MRRKRLSCALLFLALLCFFAAGCKAEAETSAPTEAPIVTAAPPTSEPTPELTPEPREDSGGEPGFFWVDGVLYCRDENGVLLCDREQDGLYFSESGAYTSGNEELDALVAATLAPILAKHPEHRDTELLRDVYDFMVENYSYLGRRIDAAEGTPWETEAAVVMLETGMGNCNYYAAAFWALARGLGYNAVTHTNPNGQRHSWTEIEIDSVPYVFDPQLAVHWKDERFMLSYEECRRRNYTVYFGVS